MLGSFDQAPVLSEEEMAAEKRRLHLLPLGYHGYDWGNADFFSYTESGAYLASLFRRASISELSLSTFADISSIRSKGTSTHGPQGPY